MVVGGLDTHLGMLYIKDIQPNSPAANCNRLRTGDQLLQVNDHCLVGVTHGEALNILKKTPPLVKLTVARKQNNESNGLELEAQRRRIADFEEPTVNQARESSTISKASHELSFSPPPERGQRPKSCISLSSFGTPLQKDLSPTTSMYGSFEEPDEYVPAYRQPESPTLNLRQDDVPVTIIDGIPDEDSDITEEEEPRPVSKSVSWAVSDEDSQVITVELLKNGRAGLGLSVSGGVDTPYDDIMVSIAAVCYVLAFSLSNTCTIVLLSSASSFSLPFCFSYSLPTSSSFPFNCRFSLSRNQKLNLKPFNYKNYEFQI